MSERVCRVCAGPAYVGLNRVECINPDCAPFDPRDVPWVVAIALPVGVVPERGRVSWLAIERSDEPRTELHFGVQEPYSACMSHVLPSRDACIDAWLADNADLVRSEPARRAVNALSTRMTDEQRATAERAYFGHVVADGTCFIVEDWTRLAWCCWEAMQ